MSKPKFYETQEFLKLNAQWRKKLEKSGFADAENKEGNLNSWQGEDFKKTSKNHQSLVYVKSKIEYYNMATSFLNEYVFDNIIDKMIWELHSEGCSKEEIIKTINKPKVKSFKVKTVIKELKAKMYGLYIKHDEI